MVKMAHNVNPFANVLVGWLLMVILMHIKMPRPTTLAI